MTKINIMILLIVLLIIAGTSTYLYLNQGLLVGNYFPKTDVSPTPTSQPIPQTKPKNIIDPNSLGQANELVEKPPQLSSKDEQVKKQLVASLKGVSGIVYQTTDFQIDYFQTDGNFEVLINNQDFSAAETKVVKWFVGRGMSLEGFCSLPLTFRPGPDFDDELLLSQGQQFSARAKECAAYSPGGV